jgi:hypothetical protein
VKIEVVEDKQNTKMWGVTLIFGLPNPEGVGEDSEK